MCSRSHSLLRALPCALALAACAADARELAVCANPDNPPYSLKDGSGFENRIAATLAQRLGATLRYFWWPQSRGFLRNTLNAGVCDVVIGVPEGQDGVRTTAAYYRSSYAVVTRADVLPGLDSLDDPRLAAAAIGVQLPGIEMAATPPGERLARRGLLSNVRGYPPFGETTSAQRIVQDVREGTIDVGVVWGPSAGELAQRAGLRIAPLAPGDGAARGEFAFAMAVRRGDDALAREIDEALPSIRAAIDRVLADHHVPRTDRTTAAEETTTRMAGGAR